MRKLIFCVIPIAFIFSSCNFSEIFVPKETDKFAREYIALIREGNLQKAFILLDPLVRNQDTSWLSKVSKILRQGGDVKSVKIVSSNVLNMPERTRTGLVYEFQYPNEWLLVEVIVEEANGNRLIAGFHTTHLPQPLEEINAFTLDGKSMAHIDILLMMMVVAAFSVFAVVLCIRTAMARKWVWILFILFGVGKLSINWTTGEFGYQIFTFQLLSASVIKQGPYAPWFLSFSIPAGAIVFLIRRKKLQIKTSEQLPVAINGDAIMGNTGGNEENV